jgi:hypothetical protein
MVFFMEMLHFERVGQCPWADAIKDYLVMADKEFIPPLSSRGSTTQADLSQGVCADGITDYFLSMASQPVIVAVEDGRCLGFMAFKLDHTCDQIGPDKLPNFYASTCVVHPDTRGRGMMRGFYEAMIAAFPTRPIYTRTWHENIGHLKVLERLGFVLLETLENDRGPGIHTVYFGRQPK